MFLVSLASPGDLELDALFEDHPCRGWPSTRCLHSSGRLTGGVFQRYPFSQHCRGTTGGHALTTVDLPPHSAHLLLQLLDLAHR